MTTPVIDDDDEDGEVTPGPDDLEPDEDYDGEPAPDEPVPGAEDLPDVRDGDAGEGDIGDDE